MTNAAATHTDAMGWTPDEIMSITAARRLHDGMSCFVGIGLPGVAANLALRTHAPSLILVYESGPIGSKPSRLPLSIGDGELAESADTIVSIPEIFNYWLQPGRIDIGFLGAAQVDRYANINTTVIGSSYAEPVVRLPGAGGAPEIAAACTSVIVVLRHSKRAFVEHVDFITTVGFGRDGNDRADLGMRGDGPTTVITDLGVLETDPSNNELTLTQVHPGVSAADVRRETDWDLAVAHDVRETAPPTAHELASLRRLNGDQ